MKTILYTVYDTASATYWQPVTAKTDQEMLRNFKSLATNAEHAIGKHPEDYSLFRIGQFDDNKAEILPETKECLATALEMVAQSRNIEKGELINFDKSAGNTT